MARPWTGLRDRFGEFWGRLRVLHSPNVVELREEVRGVACLQITEHQHDMRRRRT